MTVARKATPKPSPLNLKSFLLMGILDENLGYEYRSSELTRTMIAVTASQRLMSENVNGNCIFLLFQFDFQYCVQLSAVG